MVPKTTLEPFLILSGPTASGKSSLSLLLAKRSEKKVEIINLDSIQAYQELDIGSAKPSTEDLEAVPHHGYSVLKPTEKYNAGDFIRTTERLIEEILGRNHIPLLVGGSGFYAKALMFGMWDSPKKNETFRLEFEPKSKEELFDKLKSLDPERAKEIGMEDHYRLLRSLEVVMESGKTFLEIKESKLKNKYTYELWFVDRKPEDLKTRVSSRIEEMLKLGLVDETKKIIEKYGEDIPALKSVGYAEVVSYLRGEKPEGRKIKEGIDGLREEIILSHQKLVKKQRTFFKGQFPEKKSFLLPKDQDMIFSLWDQKIKNQS